jgi:glycosyltransferase involved in cell wall biosynthesis
MRVFYAIDSLGSGGAQRQVVELASFLRSERGVDVSVLVYRDAAFHAARLREAGVPVVLLPKHAKLDPAFPVRMRRWLRDHRPDLVHAFLLAPAFWARLALGRARLGRPVLIAAERNSLIADTFMRRTLQRFVYRSADAVTANAACAAREISERLAVPAERVHHLPNGIDLGAWDAAAAAECPVALEQGCFHVALVGRLEAQKNHRFVLDVLERVAARRRERWRIWFVGAASAAVAQALHDELGRRGLAGIVRLLPPTPAIAALMVQLDALILPSRHEGFPNVLLEAMASRLPAIAAPVGEAPSMLEPGRTGWLVETSEPEAWARALEALEDLPREARRRIGEAARATVEERYRLEVVADQHLALYRRLVADRASPRRSRADAGEA